MRLALIEGAILFAVVALLETGDKLHIVYFGIGWVALAYFRPYLTEFSADYNLSSRDEAEMKRD